MRRSQAFKEENYVESLNGDENDDDGDNGYDDDDDYHIMVTRNSWGISLSQKTARNIRHCEFQLPTTCTKYHQKL